MAKRVNINKIVAEMRAQMMANVPLRIEGRDDLWTGVESIAYYVGERLGRLHLPEGCAADCDGVLRLFLAIDPEVLRIEIYAGTKPDAFYERRGDDWANTYLAE